MSTGIKLLDQNWINMQRWGSRIINRPPIPDFFESVVNIRFVCNGCGAICVCRPDPRCRENILVGPSYLSAILLPRSSGHGHGGLIVNPFIQRVILCCHRCIASDITQAKSYGGVGPLVGVHAHAKQCCAPGSCPSPDTFFH